MFKNKYKHQIVQKGQTPLKHEQPKTHTHTHTQRTQTSKQVLEMLKAQTAQQTKQRNKTTKTITK